MPLPGNIRYYIVRIGALIRPRNGVQMCIRMEEILYEECFIQRVNKECNLPSFLAIGRRICEVVYGLNLRDGGATEWCGGLSLEDTVGSFCLTKPPAGTVKEEVQVTILWSLIVSVTMTLYTSKMPPKSRVI